MKVVIKDQDNGILIGFSKIASVLSMIPNKSRWVIKEIDGIGMLPDGKGIVSFLEEVNSAENGIEYSWEEMTLLLNALEQIYDLELQSNFNDVSSISCFDSSFWELSIEDASLIELLKLNFDDLSFSSELG